MGSMRTYQFSGESMSGLIHLYGYFSTDGSEVPENGVAGKTDLDGDPLLIPPGFSAITKNGTGDYTLTLALPWTKIVYCKIEPVISAASKIDAQIKSINPKGATVGGVAAQTINFLFVDKNAGSAVAFASKAFLVHVVLKSTPVGVQ